MEVYKKNPALGDPAIVSQELAERSRILDYLNTEKYKFEVKSEKCVCLAGKWTFFVAGLDVAGCLGKQRRTTTAKENIN